MECFPCWFSLLVLIDGLGEILEKSKYYCELLIFVMLMPCATAIWGKPYEGTFGEQVSLASVVLLTTPPGRSETDEANQTILAGVRLRL